MAVIARLIPRDFELTVARSVSVARELSDEQRARIARAWVISVEASRETPDNSLVQQAKRTERFID